MTTMYTDEGSSSGGGSGDMVAANNLSDLVSAATARTNLGLAIGTNVQAYSANLAAVAAVAVTAAGTALLDDANAAAQRTTLGLVIGTDVAAPRSDDWQYVSTTTGTASTKDVTVDSDLFDWRAYITLKDNGTGGVYAYARANGAATSLALQKETDVSSTINSEWRSDWNDAGDTGASNGAKLYMIVEIFGSRTYGDVHMRWESSGWSAAHVTAGGTKRARGVFYNGQMTSFGWTDGRSSSPQWEVILFKMKRA